MLCNSEAVADGWRVSRRCSDSGGHYKLRGNHMNSARHRRLGTHASSPPWVNRRKKRRKKNKTTKMAECGGSNRQTATRRVRGPAQFQAFSGSYGKMGRDYSRRYIPHRLATKHLRGARPVKSSSVPAQKRLLVAPRLRRVRARPVGRLANK